ncbi:hypothetical protein [Pseudomonas koreensis]|uniref:hypothetical protein n=1 Tax=Pseudomonas koreensis TaxID=198620 RepID=UPI003F868717
MTGGLSRADYHSQNLERAREEALRLFNAKAGLQGAWLNWVGAQIYSLRPAAYASMVRRELQSLQEKSET